MTEWRVVGLYDKKIIHSKLTHSLTGSFTYSLIQPCSVHSFISYYKQFRSNVVGKELPGFG